ncbi:hypothetical protein [Ralstonia pickettii]|uniref:hypothetical protein n=1 Tax=Ralstonia pickettii TaxID=329 RepID=UPI0015FE4F56|nr:hypothetical protein [Ralstonia pickettii]MBB0100129.1 hypothetical protein [Ralstonia pickettii]MBB0110087.1 hypothetical protein [Ralstonia pickettii]MBB0164763.1 hypothetical protein [Ralstonia pickettii]MBB0169793.1 hypothetical protein [Ralstonia pickettii]MBB0208126.1 hypothetical protein [Ralstonia pickettii]
MKIIERGTLPGEREWKAKCTHCGTHFEFKQREGNFHSDQRDGNYMTVGCPVCNYICYGSEKR